MANSIWQATIQDNNRNNVAGAEIDVFDEVTGLRATIKSTLAGATLTNPFFADADGFAVFYAGPGTYRVTATDTGTGQSKTHRYIPLGNAASRDSGLNINELPDIGDLGAAAFKAVGTGATDLPQNNNLGDSAFKGVGILTGQLPTADDLSMVGATQNFTNNNLNSNLFGGNTGDVVAIGRANTTSSAVFYLPTSNLTIASSITVTGTFDVKRTNLTVVAAGVTPNHSSTSSTKITQINVSGMSGLVVDDPVILTCVNVTSSVLVNI
jgi:hypothetical protein